MSTYHITYLASGRYSSRSQSQKPLFPLNLVPRWTPFILERFVQRLLKDVFTPPLAPTSQEDLVRVIGEIIRREGAEKRCGSLLICLSALFNCGMWTK